MDEASRFVDLRPEAGGAEGLLSVRPRWLVAAMLYSAAIVGATWPYVLTFRSGLPSLGDPLQHLWVMRWYRTALVEGLSPLRGMGLQYPFGVPLANFSPMHLQGFLFLLLSIVVKNDVLVFNLIWFTGLLTTGLGTYALARWVIGRERPALLAGLLAMLSGPVMMASHSFLELIFVGAFPLFLMAWMQLIDHPGAARLARAVAALTLVTMSAAYYLVFSTVVAGVYVIYATIRARREGSTRWLRQRLPWMAAFTAACLPVLALLFATQIIGVASGQHLTRPRGEFDSFGLRWWSYLVPTPRNRLFTLLERNPFASPNIGGEPYAYLGLVSLILVCVALPGKTGMRQPRFWWVLLGVMVVLSLGSSLLVAGVKVDLPASWLWDFYPPFRLIRAPSRFKYFVAVLAAVIAGGGLARLERRVRPAWARWSLFAGLVTLTWADMGHVPYSSASPPEMPRGYSWLMEHDPAAAWVDAPQISTSTYTFDNYNYMYWQSIHRGRTTGGGAGHAQFPLDNLLSWNSPFYWERLKDPGYLGRAEGESLDVVTGADGPGYIWTYLTVHDIPYVVVNRWADAGESHPGAAHLRAVGTPWYGTTVAGAGGQYHGFAHLRAVLAPALIYEDERQAIYARDRLPRPTRPVVLSTTGWLTRNASSRDGYFRPVGDRSALAVYNPDPSRPLVLGLRARGLGADRKVKLLHEGRELFAFTVPGQEPHVVSTTPLSLPGGIQRLEIRADGSVASGRGGHRLEYVPEPVSLLVSGLTIRSLTTQEEMARRTSERGSSSRR